MERMRLGWMVGALLVVSAFAAVGCNNNSDPASAGKADPNYANFGETGGTPGGTGLPATAANTPAVPGTNNPTGTPGTAPGVTGATNPGAVTPSTTPSGTRVAVDAPQAGANELAGRFKVAKGESFEYDLQQVYTIRGRDQAGANKTDQITVKQTQTIEISDVKSDVFDAKIATSAPQVSGTPTTPAANMMMQQMTGGQNQPTELTVTYNAKGEPAAATGNLRGSAGDSLLRLIGFQGIVYPTNAVKVGGTWSRSIDLAEAFGLSGVPGMQMTNTKATANYRLVSMNAGASEAVISMSMNASPKMTFTPPQGGGMGGRRQGVSQQGAGAPGGGASSRQENRQGRPGGGAGAGGPQTVTLTITISGQMTVDTATGMIKRGTYEVKTSGLPMMNSDVKATITRR